MPSRFDRETRAKAVRLVRDHVGDYESEWAAIKAVSARLGTSAEMLRRWIRQSNVDAGEVSGVSTESAREIRELKRKCAELERTIEVLKAAASFFARECDPLFR
jgi:transposase